MSLPNHPPNVIHLRARLDEGALHAMLDQLLPMTIFLDDPAETGRSGKAREGRWVSIDPTRMVDFVADKGLRLVTSGQVRWIAAGVPLEVTLHTIEILLRPEIVGPAGADKLVFRPSIESADLKNVPALLDRGIVALINRRLDAQGDQLTWDYRKTLDILVPLPASLEVASSLRLEAAAAEVAIYADAVELSLPIALHFEKVGDPSAAA